jgi:glutathione S-transferase
MGNSSSLVPDPSVEATLYYFCGRGRADQIRWLMAASNISFVQRDVDSRQKFVFLASELPFGKIPMLQIDGMEIIETQAILRYLARRAGLAGQSDFEILLVDQLVEAVRDWLTPVIAAPFVKQNAYKTTGNRNDSEVVAKMKEHFAKSADRFETILKSNGGMYLVGKSITYADILVAHCITWYVEECGGEILEPYPTLVDLQNSIISIPNVRRFIRSTLFYPLGDKSYVDAVCTILARK